MDPRKRTQWSRVAPALGMRRGEHPVSNLPAVRRVKKADVSEAKPSRWARAQQVFWDSLRRERMMQETGPGFMECPFCHGNSFSVKGIRYSSTGCLLEALGLLLAIPTLGLALLLLVPGHVAHKNAQRSQKRICNQCGQVVAEVMR